jgi:hypothetical protein
MDGTREGQSEGQGTQGAEYGRTSRRPIPRQTTAAGSGETSLSHRNKRMQRDGGKYRYFDRSSSDFFPGLSSCRACRSNYAVVAVDCLSDASASTSRRLAQEELSLPEYLQRCPKLINGHSKKRLRARGT